MKKRIQSLSFLALLAIAMGMISWGSALHAQNAPSSNQQSPDTTQQQPPTPDTPPATQQTPSSQTPDSSTPPDSGSKPSNRNAPPPDTSADASAGDTQTFSGTVMKSGDKYVLKEDSGKTYDIDHQSDVAKFDGKRVRVQGTLDPSGTKILVK